MCGTQSPLAINAIFRHYLNSHSESALKYLSYFTLVNGIIIAFVNSSFVLMKHKLVDNSPINDDLLKENLVSFRNGRKKFKMYFELQTECLFQ